eukprot:scaffold4855_cov115-Isochrysis_galbana.AAC.1
MKMEKTADATGQSCKGRRSSCNFEHPSRSSSQYEKLHFSEDEAPSSRLLPTQVVGGGWWAKKMDRRKEGGGEARGSGRRLHVSRSRGGVGHRSLATVFRVCGGELEGKPKIHSSTSRLSTPAASSTAAPPAALPAGT